MLANNPSPANWLLPDYILSHLNTPFAWGKHDCVLFAANWVRLATGADPLAGIEPWSNAMQAAAAIKQAGGLVAAMDKRFARINPHSAQDGDLALFASRIPHPASCICIFSGAHIIGPGDHGSVRNSRMLAEAAWRIK